jgi:hypothetical protein
MKEMDELKERIISLEKQNKFLKEELDNILFN